jgi:3-oxoacyl-[acyl-carrier-protein] synthase II
MGIGWTSDAHHFTLPNQATIVRAIQEALADAGIGPDDVDCINAHGTSTHKGDAVEVDSLRAFFGDRLSQIPISANKSQLGHSLGASAAVEAVLGIEGLQRQTLLPTANYLPDPQLGDIDVVPNVARRQHCELLLSNAFGFGGTNCCVVFRGV